MSLSNSSKTKKITYIALFAVLITISAWISIPIGGVPITLQTFSIFLAIFILGVKYSALSLTVYLLLGAIGLPVFAGFGSGLGTLLGLTGGYLIGFYGFIIGYAIITKLFGKGIIPTFLGSLIGLILCYAIGTAWFINIYTGTSGAIGIIATLSLTVFPFVLFDIGKIILAITLEKRLRKHI